MSPRAASSRVPHMHSPLRSDDRCDAAPAGKCVPGRAHAAPERRPSGERAAPERHSGGATIGKEGDGALGRERSTTRGSRWRSGGRWLPPARSGVAHASSRSPALSGTKQAAWGMRRIGGAGERRCTHTLGVTWRRSSTSGGAPGASAPRAGRGLPSSDLSPPLHFCARRYPARARIAPLRRPSRPAAPCGMCVPSGAHAAPERRTSGARGALGRTSPGGCAATGKQRDGSLDKWVARRHPKGRVGRHSDV